MAREAGKTQYNNFLNGFVSEATGLSFPENSVKDIDNCDIELDGTIRRRLGLDKEVGGNTFGRFDNAVGGTEGFGDGLSSNGNANKEELALSWHIWDNPGNRADLTFIVFQVGNLLTVYNYNSEPLTSRSAIESFIDTQASDSFIDIKSYAQDIYYEDFTSTSEKYYRSATTLLSSASGSGRLWMTSAAVVPFYLEYDSENNRIDANELDDGSGDGPRIRDFNGVDDNLDVGEHPQTLSDEHCYNLRNQGWPARADVKDNPDTVFTQDPIERANQEIGGYPANSDVMYFTRVSSAPGDALHTIGSFRLRNLERYNLGDSPAAKGHFKINLLSGNKDNVADDTGGTLDPNSGDPINFNGQYDESSTSGFRGCAFFAGRLWLSGDENKKRPNGVYFSQIVRKPENAGRFYQDNDPTSENFPDLLATDGGAIYIPEAANIQRLEPYGAGLLVMAENGVWFVYGGNSGFTATTYAVEKISSTGILSSRSVVRTEQVVVFWAENSIHAIALPEQGVVPIIQDIAQEKIYTFYNDIDREARIHAQGCFDPVSKKVFWSYLDQDIYSFPDKQSVFNRMLILDGRTGAFTKYSFRENADDLKYIGPAFPKKKGTKPRTVEPVVVEGEGEALVNEDTVITFTDPREVDSFINSVKVFIVNGTDSELNIGEFYDVTFRDFNYVSNIDPHNYESYVVTKPELMEDMTVYKQAPYLHSFFGRTETGFQTNLDGELVAERPSACTVRAQWDWHDSPAGNRWSKAQKAYRKRRRYVPTGAEDEFDTGAGIIYTKLKIRGRGRAVSFRYESEDNKDFRLLGYATLLTKNAL